MRFESIELLRYGHFSGEQLAFPQREHDFHLIVGGNEAGKSTLRQAFRDLLFGIPMNTPMAFLHAGPELALNAVLAGEPGRLAMGRRRKRDGGLVDEAGEKLPLDALNPWLGGVSDVFYERMFGLDHRRLEQGSRAMLQAGDDVDATLFQAAAGLATLNGVLAGLREEAASLWTPHHSRHRAWYAASDRYKEADKAVKTATVRPTAWADAERECRQMDDAFEMTRAECTQLRFMLRDIERRRRLGPLLVQIRECETVLGQLATIQDEESRLLELEAELLALDETRRRVAAHPAAIAQCESHAGLLREQLSNLLRQLGRQVSTEASASSLDELAAGLPPQPLRHEIIQLLQEGRELRAQRQTSMQAQQARLAEVEEFRARVRDLPEIAVGRALTQALEDATAAGDIGTALDGLKRKAQQEALELDRRLAALRQPEFDDITVAALQAMSPWPAEALVEHVQQRRDLRAEADAADKRVREAGLELSAAQLKVEQFRRSHQAVSRDEVLAARRERDALWENLVAGQESLDAQAESFGSLLKLADLLADRHLEAVDDAARLQTLEHDCERLQVAVQGLQQVHDDAAARLAAFDEQWRADCAQRRLPAMSPAALQGWLPGREAALQADERLQATRSELARLNERHDTLLQRLLEAMRAEAMEQAGENAEALVKVASLAEACEKARAWLAQAEKATTRRQALTEQLQRLEPLLPALKEACDRDEAAYENWSARRQAALLRAGLPEDADDAYVESAISLCADADDLWVRLRERQAEQQRLQAELQYFSQDSATLANRLGVTDFQADTASEHVTRWVARLAPLRAAERDREQAKKQLTSLLARLAEEAEGRDRKQVEEELAEVDFSSLAVEAQALSQRLEQAEHRRDELALQREKARAALDAISGGDDAAQAEARKQEALADMAEVAERYVRVYAQHRLLEHITERYRERSQGPLLVRAGQLFAELTLGAYDGLVIDEDGATLWARRVGGRLAPLDGLSDGTRDQLYLALRLAALELYMNSATALPFIADDLFVNYDDGRALAGLRQLAEVSRRTQVIFLTHHAHMVELAQQHLAEQVHVIELGT